MPSGYHATRAQGLSCEQAQPEEERDGSSDHLRRRSHRPAGPAENLWRDNAPPACASGCRASSRSRTESSGSRPRARSSGSSAEWARRAGRTSRARSTAPIAWPRRGSSAIRPRASCEPPRRSCACATRSATASRQRSSTEFSARARASTTTRSAPAWCTRTTRGWRSSARRRRAASLESAVSRTAIRRAPRPRSSAARGWAWPASSSA